MAKSSSDVYMPYHRAALVYRTAVCEVQASDPLRWSSMLKHPFEMRVIFVWLYLMITTDIRASLRQTKYKLSAMKRWREYALDDTLGPIAAKPIALTPGTFPNPPPRWVVSPDQEYRLRYYVVDGDMFSLRLSPVDTPQDSDMLPSSAYSVRLVGKEVPGAHILINTPWKFNSDCEVVVEFGGLPLHHPISVEARAIGDSLDRETQCTLPVEALSYFLERSKAVTIKLRFTLVERSVFLNAIMGVAFPGRARDIRRLVVDLMFLQEPQGAMSNVPTDHSNTVFGVECEADTQLQNDLTRVDAAVGDGPRKRPAQYDLLSEHGRTETFRDILDEILLSLDSLSQSS